MRRGGTLYGREEPGPSRHRVGAVMRGGELTGSAEGVAAAGGTGRCHGVDNLNSANNYLYLPLAACRA